jgi:hypothetical protein
MEPIRLIGITTKEICDDWNGIEDLITKYEPVYEYDDDDNETQVGLKIIDSCQYSQEDADKDWKEVMRWIKEDEARIDAYGRNWYMFGIRAVATLHFPQQFTESKIIQRISSPGLFGIESDSDDDYFEEVEEEQVAILLDMLKLMNVHVPNDFMCKLSISDTELSVDYIRDKYPVAR